jgi:hypothetical protein
MNEKDVSNTGPGTAPVDLIKRVWNLNKAKPEREKAPEQVETDIYRTATKHSSVPSRRKRRS